MKDEALQSKAHCNVENSFSKKKKKKKNTLFLQTLQISLVADIAQENQSCNNSSQINTHSVTITRHYLMLQHATEFRTNTSAQLDG
jgi:hypothetical protein